MADFARVIRELNGGATYEQLGDQLTEVVEAVRRTHKAGELTLKLRVAHNGDIGVTITDDIKVKVPEESRGSSIFFVDEHGNLLRTDPRQQELPLRAVSDTQEKLREAN